MTDLKIKAVYVLLTHFSDSGKKGGGRPPIQAWPPSSGSRARACRRRCSSCGSGTSSRRRRSRAPRARPTSRGPRLPRSPENRTVEEEQFQGYSARCPKVLIASMSSLPSMGRSPPLPPRGNEGHHGKRENPESRITVDSIQQVVEIFLNLSLVGFSRLPVLAQAARERKIGSGGSE